MTFRSCVGKEFAYQLRKSVGQQVSDQSVYSAGNVDLVVNTTPKKERAFRMQEAIRPRGAGNNTTATVVVEHALCRSLVEVLEKGTRLPLSSTIIALCIMCICCLFLGHLIFAGTTATNVQEWHVFKTWRLGGDAAPRDWPMLALKYTRAQWLANPGAELANPVYAVNFRYESHTTVGCFIEFSV
jgi:hypothetical protein